MHTKIKITMSIFTLRNKIKRKAIKV